MIYIEKDLSYFAQIKQLYMKLSIYLFLSFFVSAISLQAQDASYYFKPIPKEKNFGSIHLSFGPSLALGDFGSFSFDNPNSGYVDVGFNGSVSYQSPSLGPIGVILRGLGAIHPIDKTRFQIELEDTYKLLQDSQGIISSLSTGSWSHYGGLGGLYLSIPAGNARIELKGLGGIMVHEAADIQYTILNGGNTLTFRRIPNSISSLTWQGEAGFRYQMRGSGTVGISTSYLQSSLINPYSDILAFNGQSSGRIENVSMDVSAIGLQFSLGFKF
jgi:hypothetical protein